MFRFLVQVSMRVFTESCLNILRESLEIHARLIELFVDTGYTEGIVMRVEPV
jgi:hypothetical protein